MTRSTYLEMPSHGTILLGISAPVVQRLRNQVPEVIVTSVQRKEKAQVAPAFRSSWTPLGGPGQATEFPLNLSFLICSRVSQQWHVDIWHQVILCCQRFSCALQEVLVQSWLLPSCNNQRSLQTLLNVPSGTKPSLVENH